MQHLFILLLFRLSQQPHLIALVNTLETTVIRPECILGVIVAVWIGLLSISISVYLGLVVIVASLHATTCPEFTLILRRLLLSHRGSHYWFPRLQAILFEGDLARWNCSCQVSIFNFRYLFPIVETPTCQLDSIFVVNLVRLSKAWFIWRLCKALSLILSPDIVAHHFNTSPIKLLCVLCSTLHGDNLSSFS